MSVQDAIQTVIDELNGTIARLRIQRPEQFDSESPKRGKDLQGQCMTSVQGLLNNALALQRQIKSHCDRFGKRPA